MAIFHLDVKTGTRGGGQSASAKFDYLGREGRYAKDAEELEYKESGNLPKWAEDDPGKYWQAADEHERTNGRLFQQVEVALPVELDERQRRDLAGSFAERLTREERLPYTLAIHRGGEGGENPHAHLIISERANDGIERSAEQWFKRANGKQPERGGAKKSRTMMDKHWIAETREVWGREANRALERAGQEDRVDHRSLAAQRDESPGARRPGASSRIEPGADRPSWSAEAAGRLNRASASRRSGAEQPRAGAGAPRDRRADRAGGAGDLRGAGAAEGDL